VVDRCASPALSASVFLFGGGSGTGTGSHELGSFFIGRFYAHPVALCFSVEGGGGSIDRAFVSEMDISSRPADAGIRLGGRNCDARIVFS